MEKKCSKCLIVRNSTEFSKKRDGLKSSCKLCRKVEYQNNKDRELGKMKEYRENNPDKIRKINADYQQNNKENYKRYQKNWRLNNKPKINAHTKKRKETDPLYKLRCNLSGLIYASINRQGYSKKSKTFQLLGESFEVVQKHLIDSAIRNYEYYDPDFTYHIDHIKPCSSAKNEKELILLQHYTNLQYLTPKDNLQKNDKELEVWLKDKDTTNV
jgi:hypothetical protein